MEAGVEAVIVNHNTSPFAELCLRSLWASEQVHTPGLRVTVVDNHSDDEGLDALQAAAHELGAYFELSRWPIAEKSVNTHGDVLRDFVLAHPGSPHYLFLDADIVFIQPATLDVMHAELMADQSLWAVQARFHSTESRGPGSSLDIGAGTEHQYHAGIRAGSDWHFTLQGTGKRRCHPGCALIAGSPALHQTASTFGFATAMSLSQDKQLAGYFDTMALASAVMATHGLTYALSRAEVVHYFNVSYDDRTELTASKLEDCHRRLAVLRADPHALTTPGPWG